MNRETIMREDDSLIMYATAPYYTQEQQQNLIIIRFLHHLPMHMSWHRHISVSINLGILTSSPVALRPLIILPWHGAMINVVKKRIYTSDQVRETFMPSFPSSMLLLLYPLMFSDSLTGSCSRSIKITKNCIPPARDRITFLWKTTVLVTLNITGRNWMTGPASNKNGAEPSF